MRGIVIAGTGSGVGKTSISTGLMSLLSKRYKVQAYKVGPDFIDPMYHTAATGRPSRNVDSFLMSDDIIRNVVGHTGSDADICVVEGVRGLYEGFTGDGDTGSSAYVAKLLGFPVILVIDVGSLTRSAAAIVNGFRAFDPEVRIAGVILNKVSGQQHGDKVGVAMRTYCSDITVVGRIPKTSKAVPQRHLGLAVPDMRGGPFLEPFEELAHHIDSDEVMSIAEEASADLPVKPPYYVRDAGATAAVPVDDAYCFYYRDNLDCLRASGIEPRFFSPVAGDPIPDADMAYLGGGYPELHAEEISRNLDFLEGLANMAAEGKPVMGECGGMMTMCRSTTDKEGREFAMSGILPARSEFVSIRHGPTYVMAEATRENPFFAGYTIGHEYHYSETCPDEGGTYGYKVNRGLGIADKRDGLIAGNAMGTYMHQHALSYRDWAKGFADRLRR